MTNTNDKQTIGQEEFFNSVMIRGINFKEIEKFNTIGDLQKIEKEILRE